MRGDGRKRQKLSHSPEEESHREEHEAIGDAVARVLESQESGSSDQSASRWFKSANKNIPHSTRAQTEFDSMLPPLTTSLLAHYCY